MKKKRILILPWWVSGGIHSLWIIDGTLTRTCTGWSRWADDPNSPPLHILDEKKVTHVRKYA